MKCICFASYRNTILGRWLYLDESASRRFHICMVFLLSGSVSVSSDWQVCWTALHTRYSGTVFSPAIIHQYKNVKLQNTSEWAPVPKHANYLCGRTCGSLGSHYSRTWPGSGHICTVFPSCKPPRLLWRQIRHPGLTVVTVHSVPLCKHNTWAIRSHSHTGSVSNQIC